MICSIITAMPNTLSKVVLGFLFSFIATLAVLRASFFQKEYLHSLKEAMTEGKQ
jgi:hypothetical protein